MPSLVIPLAALLLLVTRLDAAERPPIAAADYTVAWTDGDVRTGALVGPWYTPEQRPQVAGRAINPTGEGMDWIVDRRVPVKTTAAGWVECWGGDRIPGKVVGCRGPVAGGQPAHVLISCPDAVERAGATPPATLMAAVTWVKRIVWQPHEQSYTPATLIYRDGRTITYRSLRFADDRLRLLREEGVEEVLLDSIAELHLPSRDPWTAYFDACKTAGVEKGGAMLQIETGGGLRASGGAAQMKAERQPADDNPSHWYHGLQPAWSLAPIWIALDQIRVRRYWLPHQVPLSLIAPREVRRQAELGSAWGWQVDRNVQDGPLACGGQVFASGFGVQATCELEFALPAGARRFRSRLGLDQLAGEGGCCRAEVLQAVEGRRTALYRSDLLIGSHQVRETGWLPLVSGEQAALILRADAAIREGPPESDPLDIRDIFDWLQPVLELDESWTRQRLVQGERAGL